MRVKRQTGRWWGGVVGLGLGLVLAVSALAQERSPTVSRIKERGEVTCGVSPNLPGMSAVDPRGEWGGLDVSYCRALAAAVLADATRVRFVPLATTARFEALAQGDVDVLSRATTWTLSRDAGRGLSMVGVSFHDGLRLLFWNDVAGTDLGSLPSGTRICALQGTTSFVTLKETVETRALPLVIKTYLSPDEARSALFSHTCDGFTDDGVALSAVLLAEAPRPQDFRLLPEVLSQEPLGPMVRDDDPVWFDIARWTLFALIQAEAWDLHRATVQVALTQPQDPMRRRFLGLDPGVGAPLGLDDQWIRRIVIQVGSYRDVYEGAVGSLSPLKLPRGANALVRDGGLLWAPSFR